MRRAAFVMKVKKGSEAEYEKRHDEIWPELVTELEAAGVSDYSIFLDTQTNTLFAVQKVKDHDSAGDLPGKDIVKRWWSYMADIMETNPDASPVCVPLKEVFHLD